MADRGLLIEWAMRYIDEGRAVFLLGPERLPFANCRSCWESCQTPEAKEACPHPFCHCFYAASRDKGLLVDQICDRPDSTLGVRTGLMSDLVVIDIDVKDGRDGRETIKPWLIQFPELPATRVALTPSGGWHLWLGHPSSVENPCTVGNSAGRLGAGIDVRGDGGYVLAAPSSTLDGRSYSWAAPHGYGKSVQRMSAELALAVSLRSSRPAPGAAWERGELDHPRLAQLSGVVASAPSGQRNAILFWSACRAAEGISHFGWDPVECADALTSAGLHAGLADREVRRAIESGFSTCGIRL